MSRRGAVLALVLLAGGATAESVVATEEARVERRDGQKDFDFLIGSWRVHNRRLKEPLTGSDSWYEFEATSTARKVWDGLANMDEFDGQMPSGRIQGMTLRLYDPKARQWSLYWSTAANGTL